jgi:tetratricopeptide (TPR) repeat protein
VTDSAATKGPDVRELGAAAGEDAAASGVRSAGRRPDRGQAHEHEQARPSLPPLTVGVRHGSLEHAPYRLLLGHFQGLPLTSAEARLNERSDGRLERLLLMNLYPQRLGEMAVLEPVDEAPPQGAVIMGLGPTGELTAAQLRGVVTRALVRVALNVLDRRLADEPGTAPYEPLPLGVSAVLIGSSTGGGLTVEGSVRALIDGVLVANAGLGRLKVGIRDGQHPATDVVRFDVLEMIERYEDRVDLVVGVLAGLQHLDARVPDRGRRQAVSYNLKPESGEGRSTANPPIDAAGEVWRRVDIRATESAGDATVRLEFTSIGRLARAERVLGDVERAIVDRLVATAINDPSDEAVGGALFELVIPQELKGELGSGENLQLLVGPQEADLPWELLRPRPEDYEQQVPLALRVGLLRQFRESDELRFGARRASANNVLVIGNPPSGGLPSLTGAAAEAREVANQFSPQPGSDLTKDRTDERWSVRSIIWPGAEEESRVGADAPPRPTDALYALLNGDWRVIHIAAHGEFTDEAVTTGVVLGSIHLTANVFSKLAVVPDLVMLNACHLGRVSEGEPRLTGANRSAASVARALVQLGVRAVVVAGWAVDDRAAERFATQLYGDLLAGDDFGHAVTRARFAAWSIAKSSLTWGAYQCYGDPGFRLSPRAQRRADGRPNTSGDLRRRVQQLRARASDQGRSAATDPRHTLVQLRNDLADLEARAAELDAWEVSSELAGAWAELLDFDRAIELYEEALARGGSAVRLEAIEQLGNLQIREAIRRHRAGRSDGVADYVASARTWLMRAAKIAESGERLALLGSYHKKCATMKSGAERLQHLDEARVYYERANAATETPYHQLNARQLGAIARICACDGDGAVETAVAAAVGTAAQSEPAGVEAAPAAKPEKAPNFWSRAARGDLLLTALVEEVAVGRPDEEIGPERLEEWTVTRDEMVAHYVGAFRLRSSARERASVIDHLDDLALLLPVDHPLADLLRRAAKELRAWPGPERSSAG